MVSVIFAVLELSFWAITTVVKLLWKMKAENHVLDLYNLEKGKGKGEEGA